jgi:hypothetical protein
MHQKFIAALQIEKDDWCDECSDDPGLRFYGSNK